MIVAYLIAGFVVGLVAGLWLARPNDPYDAVHDPGEMRLACLIREGRAPDPDDLPNGYALEDYRRYRASIDAYLTHEGGHRDA